MKILIQHRTTYRYKVAVTFEQHQVMTRPREGHDLHIESSILEITPAHQIHWMRDVNGNCIAKIDFSEPSEKLMIYSELVLQHYDINPFDFRLDEGAEHYPFVYQPGTKMELTPYTHIICPKDTEVLSLWLNQFWKPGETINTLDLLQKLNLYINRTFVYRRRDEHGVQSPAETITKNAGSCRDFAALFIEACRCWGLAARFVSGYMLCAAAESGGASTHAWAEVYLPGAGWKGFDPTSGIVIGEQHVAVACSRDPEKACPVSGTYIGTSDAFLGVEVDVKVTKLDSSQK